MFDIKTIIKKTLITTLTASFACGLLFTTQNAHATLTQDEINNIKLISSTINTDIDLNVSFDCTKKSLEFCQALYICLIYKNILTTYNDTFKCLSKSSIAKSVIDSTCPSPAFHHSSEIILSTGSDVS